MIERLARILLAFAVAFVFTGQMEAAAQHCSRLALADMALDETAEAAPCHGDEKAPAVSKPSHQDVAKDHCECVAVLMACASTPLASVSTLMAPYAWARPEAIGFASIEPAPDWRPPRA